MHMGKADNAAQVTKALQDVTNQSISSQTVHHNLKKSGLLPVVKKKQPLLKPIDKSICWHAEIMLRKHTSTLAQCRSWEYRSKSVGCIAACPN